MEIFSDESNMGLSQEMDSLMSMMHFQTDRAISSAHSDRAIPEIQNILGLLSYRVLIIRILTEYKQVEDENNKESF